ncbi:MAG: hypothetical protein ACLTCP_13495 [Ruminococcus bicirculans (ex Wegman et al. 2014)]
MSAGVLWQRLLIRTIQKWAAEYKELSELLTPQEYAQARSTVNDAFTPARPLLTEFTELSAISALTAVMF